MTRPNVSLDTKQKLIADLLATGMTPREAAKAAHVQPSYIEILLKGSLFSLEVDRARERYVKDKLNDFSKMVADELAENVKVAKAIRDNESAKDSDRLRAVELLTDRIVARPRPSESTTPTQTTRIVLTDDRTKQLQIALDEDAIDVAGRPGKKEE